MFHLLTDLGPTRSAPYAPVVKNNRFAAWRKQNVPCIRRRKHEMKWREKYSQMLQQPAGSKSWIFFSVLVLHLRACITKPFYTLGSTESNMELLYLGAVYPLNTEGTLRDFVPKKCRSFYPMMNMFHRKRYST